MRISPSGAFEVIDVAEDGAEVLPVHDAATPDPSMAFMLSWLGNVDDGVTPLGVFRGVVCSAYDDQLREQ